VRPEAFALPSYDPTEREALRAFSSWLRWLCGVFKAHERPHFHCLLLLPHEPSRDELRAISASWGLHGFATTERYAADRNGAAYLMRHNAWEVGVACPRIKPDCRRTRGCREAKRVWT
jgi:hypothetical protein